MSWKRKIPNKEGYWIRATPTNKLKIHYIKMHNGNLTIIWKGQQFSVKEIDYVLGGYYWIHISITHPPFIS